MFVFVTWWLIQVRRSFVCSLVSDRVDTVNLLCAPTLSVTIVRLCGVLVDAFFLFFSVCFYCLNGKCG